ncbi:MAG TPA: hypothetical protein VFQ38_10355 [Longimicrobiales bacterium]|nr:hypothetical protein [Longimicrobiales bacterium]
MPIRVHAARLVRSLPRPALALAGVLSMAACGRPVASPSGAAAPRGVSSARELRLPTVRDTTRAFHFLARRTGDTTTIDLGLTTLGDRPGAEDGGHASFRQVQASPKREFYDTLEVRVNGLAPRWEHLRLGARRIRIEYDGTRVHRWDQTGDSVPRTATVDFPTPVFAFNQVHMLVRSVPLRVGYTTVLPLYSEGTAELEHDTITVIAAPGPDARGWTVRFADPAIVSTYTLDATTREIVGYRVLQRSGKAELWWEFVEK